MIYNDEDLFKKKCMNIYIIQILNKIKLSVLMGNKIRDSIKQIC